jgi:ABC-type cobalamin/Fe3+-siderophores transport system ATPase subunit
MTESPTTPTILSESDWPETLASACQCIIKTKGHAMLCVVGRSGSGKSTLGKQIRKKGLPGIPPSWIAVIDDGVLSVPLLGIFNRRIKHRSKERDELAPFLPHLRRKKLLVYVSSRPELRLSACDLVVRVRCNEDERLRRLKKRNEDGECRFHKSAMEPDTISIPTSRFFEFFSH